MNVDKADTPTRKPTKEELQRISSRLRHRGYTDALFNEVSEAYEKLHKGMKAVWEYAPLGAPNPLDVQQRELYGFRKVTMDEIPEGTPVPHSQDTGEVRISDAILMSAPQEIYAAYYATDQVSAQEDAQLPKTEYLESLKERGSGKAYGDIKSGTEILSVDIQRAAGKEGEK